MDAALLIHMVRRRLPLLVLAAVLGAALGLAAALLMPRTYVAGARLVVEQGQIPSDLAASTVGTETIEQLQIIEQRLLSRDSLLALAARLGLAQTGAADAPIDSDRVVQDMRSRIRFVTSGGQAANRGPAQALLVSITFRAPDAPVAAQAVDDLVDRLLREDAAMRNGIARQTLDFFAAEADRLERALAEQDARILDFRQDNHAALPESLDFRRGQLAQAEDRLEDLDRAEAALRDRRARLERDLTAATAGTGPLATPEQARLAALRADLAQAQAVLAPSNPKLWVLVATFAAAEAAQAAIAPTAAAPSPLRREIEAAEAEAARLARERAVLQARQSAVEASIAATPANAIALAALERAQTALQTRYAETLAKKARAETGEVIEALAKGRRISVIEPAAVPVAPEGPPRRLVVAAGALGGLALALSVLVGLELTNRSIRRPEDLAAALGIAPIAVLPWLPAAPRPWQRRAAASGVAAAALAVLPLALWWTAGRNAPPPAVTAAPAALPPAPPADPHRPPPAPAAGLRLPG